MARCSFILVAEFLLKNVKTKKCDSFLKSNDYEAKNKTISALHREKNFPTENTFTVIVMWCWKLHHLSYLGLFDVNIQLKYWIQHGIVASQVRSYIWVQPTIWKNSRTFSGQNAKIPKQKTKKSSLT